jgi:hypothetical protein
VAIDTCVDEHGIWLDKGEFEAIIDSLKDEMLTMDTPAYIAASLEEAVEILSGDEGLISEWKDFGAVTRMLQLRILVDNPWLAKLLIALPGSLPS